MLYDWSMDSNHSTLFYSREFLKFKPPSPKPARIPPQAPPAGGKSAEARRIHSPRRIVSPRLIRISIFNHLDSARNSFELCPTNTANNKNSTPIGVLFLLFAEAEGFEPSNRFPG